MLLLRIDVTTGKDQDAAELKVFGGAELRQGFCIRRSLAR